MSVTRPPDFSSAYVWGKSGLTVGHSLALGTIRALSHNGRPSSGLPKEPWAVVVKDDEGGVAAAASPAFAGGLFWAWTAEGLLFGDNVREMVAALAPHVWLDPEFIRGFATLPYELPGTSTPFHQIHRIVPGTTAIWKPRTMAPPRTMTSPRTLEWCGPKSWGEPTVEGPGTLERYRATFDASIDELFTDGPIYTHMSGGLDSTFVAASLVRHATADNPVHALCHSPVPEAELRPRGSWDPDDFPIATAMAQAYPGRLVVHRVCADPSDRPLEAAATAAASRGVPTFNPGNQVWINRVSHIAAAAGAAQVFSGTNGNAAFSYHHNYAAGYYLRNRRLRAAWNSIDPEAPGLPAVAALRARASAPLVGAVRSALPTWATRPLERTLRGRRQRPAMDYLSLVGLGHEGARPTIGVNSRAQFLHWLSGSGPLRTAAMFSGAPVPKLDPFTTRDLLDLAAAITPMEWSRGPGPRGYARMLGEGRVPDSIRLRSRRGGQAWDSWFLIRNDRDRYFDEVAALGTTPILGGWVDDAVLRAQLTSWPWGQVQGPSLLSVQAMDRILSLADFVRAANDWCRG